MLCDVCIFDCWYGGLQDHGKSTAQILMNLAGQVWHVLRKKPLKFDVNQGWSHKLYFTFINIVRSNI